MTNALDYYDSKDYKNTSKTIQLVIDAHEKGKPWNLEGYNPKEHNEKVSDFYVLAAKANTHLRNYELAYKNSKKALEVNPNHSTYYGLSVSAYNLGNYNESLDSINKAIELKPINSEPNMSVYQQIKEKCLNHLSSGR